MFIRFPNFVANIERRSSGAMILDYLLIMLPEHGIDPFKRLFNTVVQEKDEHPDRFREIMQPMGRRDSDIYVRYKKCFGFATSGSGAFSRTELYSTTLKNAARQAGDRVYDKKLIDQISGLIVKNGRVDHDADGHDDLVIAWLMCFWLLTQGKNLSFYGIDSKDIGADVAPEEEEKLAPIDHFQRFEQLQIRQQIVDISERLMNERDEYVVKRYEHELRVLDSRLILEEGDVFSVDELIRQAGENRRGRRRTMNNYHQHNSHMQDTPLATYGVQSHHQYMGGQFSDRPLSVSEMIRGY
jgi:hypothetical protein